MDLREKERGQSASQGVGARDDPRDPGEMLGPGRRRQARAHHQDLREELIVLDRGDPEVLRERISHRTGPAQGGEIERWIVVRPGQGYELGLESFREAVEAHHSNPFGAAGEASGHRGIRPRVG